MNIGIYLSTVNLLILSMLYFFWIELKKYKEDIDGLAEYLYDKMNKEEDGDRTGDKPTSE